MRDAEIHNHDYGQSGPEVKDGKSYQHKGAAGQKERACGDRLSPKQVNISVLIIARGKEKANGSMQNL